MSLRRRHFSTITFYYLFNNYTLLWLWSIFIFHFVMSAIYFCFNVGSNINWNTSNMNLVMSALCYSNIIQNVIKFTHRNNCMNEHKYKYKYKINNKQTNKQFRYWHGRHFMGMDSEWKRKLVHVENVWNSHKLTVLAIMNFWIFSSSKRVLKINHMIRLIRSWNQP